MEYTGAGDPEKGVQTFSNVCSCHLVSIKFFYMGTNEHEIKKWTVKIWKQVSFRKQSLKIHVPTQTKMQVID